MKNATTLIDDYLEDIDRSVSLRLKRTITPRETTLTDELLALLDPVTRDREDPKQPYTKLESKLAELSDPVAPFPAPVRLTTILHPTNYEARISQADFAVVIEADRPGARLAGYWEVYFMQAKRLYPHRRDVGFAPVYDMNSEFSALTAKQHSAISLRSEMFGIDTMRYLYYMPRSLAIVPGTPPDGIWVGQPSKDAHARTAKDVYARGRDDTMPLRSFLMKSFARAGTWRPVERRIVDREPSHIRRDTRVRERDTRMREFARGVALGEPDAIEEVAAALRKKGLEAKSISSLLPRATLSIKVPPAPEPRPAATPGRGESLDQESHSTPEP